MERCGKLIPFMVSIFQNLIHDMKYSFDSLLPILEPLFSRSNREALNYFELRPSETFHIEFYPISNRFIKNK